MSRKEKIKNWGKRHWRMVLIGLLTAALIVSLSLTLPRLVVVRGELASVRGELNNVQAQLVNVTEERDGLKADLITVTANLTADLIGKIKALADCQEDKEELEEALAEALGKNLPTKAEVEDFLHANFNTCRTTTVDGLREAFPEIIIEGLPLTPQGEGGSCYILVGVAEGGFFIVGETLRPLIVW